MISTGTKNFKWNHLVFYYTAKVINGHALTGADKKTIFGLNCSLEQGGRLLNLMIDLKKMGEFKPGRTVLSKMDDKVVANFGVFSDTGALNSRAKSIEKALDIFVA